MEIVWVETSICHIAFFCDWWSSPSLLILVLVPFWHPLLLVAIIIIASLVNLILIVFILSLRIDLILIVIFYLIRLSSILFDCRLMSFVLSSRSIIPVVLGNGDNCTEIFRTKGHVFCLLIDVLFWPFRRNMIIWMTMVCVVRLTFKDVHNFFQQLITVLDFLVWKISCLVRVQIFSYVGLIIMDLLWVMFWMVTVSICRHPYFLSIVLHTYNL